ncbi:SGNH/GDSL hydrolase family protein [Glutamicibacter arilaitensis]|uniref:SGNH/GDSL hydrolase family protein n=1 Tax=Glutamicibacter arilaitensis TaxID=256701 RepID=UPI003FD0D35F
MYRNLFRSFAAILLTIAFSIAGSYCHNNGHNLAPNSKALIVGDSISAGWSTTNQNDGYAFRVKEKLKESHIHVTSQVKSGITVEEHVSTYAALAGMNLIIVELGTNDFRQGHSLEKFAIDYNILLGKLRASNVNRLVCLGVFEPKSTRQRAFDDVIENECAKYDGSFISLSDVYDMKKTRGPVEHISWKGTADLGHPNDLGHKIMAMRVLSRLGNFM